jgi:transposase
MSRIHLTDGQWAFIQPLLPPPARTGRPRANDRRTIESSVYLLITGCRWQDLPREYGAPTMVWRRLKRWGEEGVWERIWRAALATLDRQGQLDWSMAFLDGSFAPAKRGGELVGVTKKGKGTKWMLVVDGNGLPLGFHLDSANTAEVRQAERTLDTMAVPRPRGRPKRRPEKLVADRGYDSNAFRRALRRRGIRMCIPPKRRPANWRPKRGRPVVACRTDYRRRFTVERTFAWLGNFRRLLIRWERLESVMNSTWSGRKDGAMATPPPPTPRKPYPSDVSDEEWAFVAPYLALVRADAPQRRHDLREVLNALRWLAAGAFEAMVHDLRLLLRVAAGRPGQPSAAILDSRSLQSTPRVAHEAGMTGTSGAKAPRCMPPSTPWAICSRST